MAGRGKIIGGAIAGVILLILIAALVSPTRPTVASAPTPTPTPTPTSSSMTINQAWAALPLVERANICSVLDYAQGTLFESALLKYYNATVDYIPPGTIVCTGVLDETAQQLWDAMPMEQKSEVCSQEDDEMKLFTFGLNANDSDVQQSAFGITEEEAEDVSFSWEDEITAAALDCSTVPSVFTPERAWKAMSKSQKAAVCAKDDKDRRKAFNSNAPDGAPKFDYDEVDMAVSCPTPKKSDHKVVGERELAKIIKSPDDYIGRDIIVYAEVTQFDSATGTYSFRGDVANRNIKSYGYWVGGTNAMFNGGGDALENVVEGDIVKMWVTVTGSQTYDTQIGGNATAPEFDVNHIAVIG